MKGKQKLPPLNDTIFQINSSAPSWGSLVVQSALSFSLRTFPHLPPAGWGRPCPQWRERSMIIGSLQRDQIVNASYCMAQMALNQGRKLEHGNLSKNDSKYKQQRDVPTAVSPNHQTTARSSGPLLVLPMQERQHLAASAGTGWSLGLQIHTLVMKLLFGRWPIKPARLLGRPEI